MKFSDIHYERPNFDALHENIESLLSQFETAPKGEVQFNIYEEIMALRNSFRTQHALARIRHFLNVNDTFYKEEFRQFSLVLPKHSLLHDKLCRLILSSPFKDELSHKLGPLTLRNMELDCMLISEDIVNDMREESALVSRYISLISNLKADFNGELMPLTLLAPYKESADRSVRHAAFVAEGLCYESIKPELDEIFDKLVKNRSTQAKKLGFRSYVELGYARMTRNCYGVTEVSSFKEQIRTELVPLFSKIQVERSRRLGLDALSFHDLTLYDKKGAPKPHIFGDELMASAKEVYMEMGEPFSSFVELMYNNELFEVYAKEAKMPGGFCSYLPDYKYPFIYANFNRTASDVYVITHEFGHAFARYLISNAKKKYYSNPTMDINETHSMTMEFLLSSNYDRFFGDDAKRYAGKHLEDTVLFIPYACQVDEFQERIYANPELSPSERDALWLEIEAQYRPNIAYNELPFYSGGSGWQKQTHIYKSPFYYIDYALAQTVALQFYALFLEDKEICLNLYLKFIAHSSDMSFTDLIEHCGLKSPFKSGNIGQIISVLKHCRDLQI